MSNRIRQCFALLLTLALCTTGVPLSAWAEATQPEDPEVTTEVQEDAVEPQVLFRTHAIGAPSWNDDEGWDSYAPSQESEDNVGDPLLESEDAKCELTPLDSLQLQLLGLDAANGISYRIRDANGEWQQEWTSSPNAATCELGITGVQVRLSEELDATYDLWYCAKDNNGAQMDWVLADQALQTEGVEPLCGFEAVLVANGQTPDQRDEGSTPTQDDAQEEGALDQNLATDLDDTQTDSQPNPDPEPADDASGEESDPNGGDALVDAPEATEAPTEEEPSVTVQQDNASEQTQNTKSSAAKSTTSASAAIEVVKPESSSTMKSTKTSTSSKKSASVVQAEQATPSLLYRARVQQTGWQGWKKNGKTAGTSGKGLYVDGLRFILKNADGGLSYRVRIQGEGWRPTVTNSKATGKKSQPIEAVKIKLTGSIAKTYDIYYR
ncbi:MAG: hypothetical protein Q4A07_08765, partial [Coriobacteriales bacterium]|nr:hypothetical protein [Coriobacteriales bacterium]